MTPGRIVELRDPDGPYATIRILEEGRGRVVSSCGCSVRAGDCLILPEGETWDSASEELGTFTRLSPDDLVREPSPEEVEDPLDAEIGATLDQDDDVIREAQARVERCPPPGGELPPGFSLLREEDAPRGGQVEPFPRRPPVREDDAA